MLRRLGSQTNVGLLFFMTNYLQAEINTAGKFALLSLKSEIGQKVAVCDDDDATLLKIKVMLDSLNTNSGSTN